MNHSQAIFLSLSSMDIPKNRPQIGDGSLLWPPHDAMMQHTFKATSHQTMGASFMIRFQGGLSGLSSFSFFFVYNIIDHEIMLHSAFCLCLKFRYL